LAKRKPAELSFSKPHRRSTDKAAGGIGHRPGEKKMSKTVIEIVRVGNIGAGPRHYYSLDVGKKEVCRVKDTVEIKFDNGKSYTFQVATGELVIPGAPAIEPAEPAPEKPLQVVRYAGSPFNERLVKDKLTGEVK
jgi:hypothetical protein